MILDAKRQMISSGESKLAYCMSGQYIRAGNAS